MAITRVRATVAGRVQGVFFRGATEREATVLALRGWVRNLPDGRVELVAEGESSAVETLVAWARSGPSGARVDELLVTVDAGEDALPPFEVRR